MAGCASYGYPNYTIDLSVCLPPYFEALLPTNRKAPVPFAGGLATAGKQTKCACAIRQPCPWTNECNVYSAGQGAPFSVITHMFAIYMHMCMCIYIYISGYIYIYIALSIFLSLSLYLLLPRTPIRRALQQPSVDSGRCKERREISPKPWVATASARPGRSAGRPVGLGGWHRQADRLAP